MTQESESPGVRLQELRIDFNERVVETLADDGSRVRLTFSAGQILQQILLGGELDGVAQRLLQASPPEAEARPADPAPETADPDSQTLEPAPARREKTPALVLPGRLKNAPTEGRPDGHGKPTAWAPFLTHVEGHADALLVSASFHNHTRDIALRLSAGDAITAQGYLHPNRDPSRLASFSIFHLIVYPGKPPSTTS